jgi:hypothetical protein
MEIACRAFLSIHGDIPGREVSPHLSLYFFLSFHQMLAFIQYIYTYGFCRACSACTGFFRLFNTQNGALRSPRPSHGSFADPFSKINDIRKKTPRKMEKSQYGKKSAKVYLFSLKNAPQVALGTYMFLRLGIDSIMSAVSWQSTPPSL